MRTAVEGRRIQPKRSHAYRRPRVHVTRPNRNRPDDAALPKLDEKVSVLVGHFEELVEFLPVVAESKGTTQMPEQKCRDQWQFLQRELEGELVLPVVRPLSRCAGQLQGDGVAPCSSRA